MGSRGRGRALTRPAWMSQGDGHPLPSLPSAIKKEKVPVTTNALPLNWAQAKTADGKTYWYNTKTKETTWTLPSTVTRTSHVSTSVKAESSLIRASEWREYQTENGRTYYHNAKSNETRWETPEGFKSAKSADVVGVKRVAPQRDDVKQNGTLAQEDSRKVRKVESGSGGFATGAGDWAEAKTKEGKVYYYNTRTRETSWTRPEGMGKENGHVISLPAQTWQVGAKRGRTGTGVDNRRRGGRKRARAVQRPRHPDGSAMSDKSAEKYLIKEERRKASKKSSRKGGDEVSVSAKVKPCCEWTKEELDEGKKTFEDILRENEITTDTIWLETMTRCVRDPRYATCLPGHGSRKDVFLNYQARLKKQARISALTKLRSAREGFATLLEETFDNESEKMRSFSDFPPTLKTQFEADERYKALDKPEERSNLIRLYFAHRDRLIRDRHLARREANMVLMRKCLDGMTHPDLRDTPKKEVEEKDEQNVDTEENGQVETDADKKSNDKKRQENFLTERTSYRQMCALIENEPFFKELNSRERGIVYEDWIRDVTRIADDRILAEKEERKKKARANRALLQNHIEELVWAGEVHPRANPRDVEAKILEKPPEDFNMGELDAKLSFVFGKAMECVDEKIATFQKSFDEILKESDAKIEDDSEKTIISENEKLAKSFRDKEIPDVAVEALFWDARENAREQKRLAHRRRRRAKADLEDLLIRKRVGGDAVFEEVRDALGKRSAWIDYEEFAGEEELKRLFSEHVKHEKEREERLKARRAQDEARDAKLRKEAEERLAKSGRLPSRGSPGMIAPAMMGNEEDTGWAVAISARPKSEKEKAEEMLRRKKEILAGVSGLKADKVKKTKS